ncbi:MAG: RadC family protein [Eubacteriales bacterium]
METQQTANDVREFGTAVYGHHRDRMLERFRTTPPELFADHEILEMVLFFTRSRVNTGDIAYRLIDRFGSFYGVLEADLPEIARVEGVGLRSAVQLKLIHECAIRFAAGKRKHTERIDSSEAAGQYFIKKLGMKKRECVMVMLLDNHSSFIEAKILFEGVVNCAPLNFRKIIEFVCSCNAASFYIAHNHPSGELVPSADDLQNTDDLRKLCADLDVDFMDHILVAGDSCLSIMDYITERNRETHFPWKKTL